MTTPFLGAVLAGGASRRMGQPKALTAVDGQPMGAHVVSALRAAGAREVVMVGGEPEWAVALGLAMVADRWHGEGPLAGLATAVAQGRADELVVVVACDQPDIGPALIRRLVEHVDASRDDGVLASAPIVGARVQPFPSAWRAGAAHALGGLVEGGARRADAGFGLAPPILVETSADEVADIDDPGDLARRLSRPTNFGGTRGRS